MSVNSELKATSFQSVIHAVEIYGIVLLDLKGRIVSWNLGAKELLGFSEAEAPRSEF
jgi:PAS domain-containing protein